MPYGRIAAADFPVIVKPRRGAGAQATFRADSPAQLAALLPAARAAMPGEDFLIQPFVSGMGASVAFLVGPQGSVPLLPCRQHLVTSGRLTYQGGSLPLPSPQSDRAVHLGRRVIEAVAGLRGYVGVDLVLGEEANGSRDAVIEVNPRLTTSYIGLRRLARFNLGEAIVHAVRGERVELAWRPGRAVFRTDGTVAESDGGGAS